jgi:hypothetical protein
MGSTPGGRGRPKAPQPTIIKHIFVMVSAKMRANPHPGSSDRGARPAARPLSRPGQPDTTVETNAFSSHRSFISDQALSTRCL